MPVSCAAADRARHPKTSRGLLREAPAVRFVWIAAEKAEYTIVECCRALRVSPSGFYVWQQRPESMHAVRDRQLRLLIRASHEGSRRVRKSARTSVGDIPPSARSARRSSNAARLTQRSQTVHRIGSSPLCRLWSLWLSVCGYRVCAVCGRPQVAGTYGYSIRFVCPFSVPSMAASRLPSALRR